MTKFLYLSLAIFFEVTGTLFLPASQSFTKIVPTVTLVICYICSFYFLSVTIKYIPLSIVYASWTGLGVFCVTILSMYFYKEKINIEILIGLILIIFGVIIINYFKSNIN